MLRRIGLGFMASGVVWKSIEVASAKEKDDTQPLSTEDVGATAPRLVIVGGGYSGSKLAYYLDSIFNITLIDTKNYFEFTPDIVHLVGSPWNAEMDAAADRLIVLHRFYTRRANVVTGKVSHCGDDSVEVGVETNGKVVKHSLRYDMLVLALGERKPFPFGSNARTKSQRIAELKAFNHFIKEHCERVAIVGGGPLGCSLALEIAEAYPKKDVHLYHSTHSLTPSLPKVVQRYAFEKLSQQPNVTLHCGRRVIKVRSSVDRGGGHTYEVQHGEEPGSSVPRKVRSIFHHVAFGLEGKRSSAGERQKRPSPQPLADPCVDQGFDFVFHCTGSTPRTPEVSSQPFHKEHLTDTGHYRVSRYLQLFGRPNVFAVGRCNNMPWVRSYGNSEVQVNLLFRLFQQAFVAGTLTFDPREGIKVNKMLLPRMFVSFGDHGALGSTPWDGGLTGTTALREMLGTRKSLTQLFQKPVFYKTHQGDKIQRNFEQWREKEPTTNVEDFGVCGV